ncbi:hypothetical protein D3C85_239460 [compost metagenome]
MDKDKDGFLTVTLGMFDKNIPADVFDDFRKRCLAGQIHSALGSPGIIPGEPTETFFKRINSVDDANVCAKILDVEMSPDGKRMIGKITPAGPQGDVLRRLLKSGEVTFSMRSFHAREDLRKERPSHVVTYDLISPS